MSIKTLVFVLLLYIALVWVAAVGLQTGSDIQTFGLLWTAVGILAVLAFVIVSRLLGAWRIYRARQKPAPEKPVEKVHPDDQAISALITGAKAALAKSPRLAGTTSKPEIHQLPLYLLVGPEGSGKTSTFVNSGVEPQLLAGRVTDNRRPERTEYMNLWFWEGSIIADLSGKAFSSGPEVWTRLLRALRGEDRRAFWRRMLNDRQTQCSLRGVVAFCHAKELIGASADPQRFERNCRDWKDRLQTIRETFGAPYPVYEVTTNCDSIPFFSDFFKRLTEKDASQVLGGALRAPSDSVGTGEEALGQRLLRSFRELYRSIVDRRVICLAQETETKRRPAIYEFPRELKRIRGALVQFLTEALCARSLEPGPLLRGFYFTAVREGAPAEDAPAAGGEWSAVDLDGSRVLRGDATRMFRSDDFSYVDRPALHNRGGRWLFAGDIFRRVIVVDHANAPQSVLRDGRVERYRRIVLFATVFLCVLIWAGLTVSWAGNRSLLDGIRSAATGAPAAGQRGTSLEALRALEKMRIQLQTLRDGPGISMHMGLYSGDRVMANLRNAYFRRFQQLLLNPINSQIVEFLDSADGNKSDDLYRLLKTHLMITTGDCQVDSRLVADVLTQENRAPTQDGDMTEWMTLASRQIRFYAEELKHGNPCRLTKDTVACNRARDILQKQRGVSGFYSELISKAGQSVGKPRQLADLAPLSGQDLMGPADVDAAFSPEGWRYVNQHSKDLRVTPIDACALGIASSKADANAIQQLYIRDYVEAWRKYLAGFEVVRYKNAKDAADKIAIFSDHKSPLLALFALIADATDFRPSGAAKAIDRGSQYFKKMFGSGPGEQASDAARKVVDGDVLKIADTFQPVHWVVSPGSDTWVGEKNAAYVEALTQLGHSMQDIADSKSPGDSALYQSATQNYEKALDAARQIAKGFKPIEVGGVDAIVERLLEEPVERTRRFIIDPFDGVKRKIDGEFQSLCRTSVLRKYPFQSDGMDATIPEFTSLFAPGTGRIWRFQSESLADMITKDGSVWKVKDPSQKLVPTTRLLNFINRAQGVTSAFFPAGATAPHLTYVLRPKLDSSVAGSVVVALEADGQQHQWTNSYQAPFTWPAQSGAKAGAEISVTAGFKLGIASWDGVWGIFRVIAVAEPRALQAPVIEWKYSGGREGKPVEIQPAPVRLEIVEFPAGYDVFNAKFYEGLQCAGPAIQ